ncbi:ABC transporter ATP-binding protein [Rothia sp. CCM 9417]|uniref:ABC transporter ATP-binding protein n=1 Tax=Rothia sp. CCM 9417 TaxID=3402657 RepID=UPI003AD9E1FD
MSLRLLRVKPLPTPEPAPFVHTNKHDLTLWRYSGPIRGRWFAGLLVAITSAIVAISIPQVLGWIVDSLLTDQPTVQAIWVGGGIVLALGLLQSGLFLLRRQLVVEPASEVENTMRVRIFDRLLRSPVTFHDRWPSGQLLTRTMSDLGTVRRWTAFGLIQLITTAIQVLVGTLYMFAGSWQLALIFLASLPVTVFFIWRFVRTFRQLTRASQEKAGDLATSVEESVQGIRVLKALGRGDHALAGFATSSAELKDLEIRRGRATGAMRMQTAMTSGLSLALALIVGLQLVAAGSLSVGRLTGYFATVAMLTGQVERSGMLLSMYLAAKVSMDRHRAVMVGAPGEEVELVAGSPLSPSTAQAAALRFDRVDFSYGPAERPVLRGFSLDIGPGEIIALVGSTGSGKSTVLHLVQRLYQPNSGALYLDGHDIASLPLPELRSSVAIAFEEPVLFSTSVRENVLLGVQDQGLTEAELTRRLENALKVAAADFVARLPEGAETVIGEEGMSLSGGQRQRLSLARAIATNPAVLLLDDPLSALDVTTEERVIDQLKQELTKTTTLLTAHRPSTVALADRVVLLQDGQVAAVGSHTELLARADYRELMAPEAPAQEGLA